MRRAEKLRRRPIVIAHRGASAYLPEHTLAAKAMAHAMGADYLEQDVVATKDDELVVLHDIYLEDVSNVADVFNDRHRQDGRYYARDFTLSELRQLEITERAGSAGDVAHYPQRFPRHHSRFGVVTLDEELAMIAGLNHSTGREAGVYTEIKRPAWHRAEGVELGDLVLAALARYGYTEASDMAFVQCFDLDETKRLREDCGTRLKLIQLIGENAWGESPSDFDFLKTAEGLREIAGVADGIGPWFEQLLGAAQTKESGIDSTPTLVKAAHDAGLAVHPYTFRADDLAAGFTSFEQQVRWAVSRGCVDGFFTDFPDRAIRVLDEMPFSVAVSGSRRA